MYKKKIALLMFAATVLNQVVTPAVTFASPTLANYQQVKSEVEEEELKVENTENMSVRVFDLYKHKDLASYNEVYQMNTSNIESIRQNGGTYGSSTIDKAIDGDFSTHWETKTPNSTKFTNEVVISFKEADTISRLVYAARQDGAKGKGFATDLSLYVSESVEGDDFELLGTTKYTGSTGDIIEIKFAPTTMKRIKFVFNEANQGWASASEFQFYREDTVKDKMNDLFTNQAYMEVKEAYASVEVLTQLKEEVISHPLVNDFTANIDLAISIIENGETFEGRVFQAEQYGDRQAHARNNLQFGFGNNNQPTGITALPGETFTVYVDAEEGKPLPKLVFSQQEGSFANWERSVQLKVGKNVITVPEVPTDNWYQHTVTKGGPVYIYNPYTEAQQGSAPIIRIESGERHPYLTAETDTEEFIAYLKDYKKRLDEDAAAHPDVKDRTMIDTFEFVTKHVVFTGTASGAYEAYVKQGMDPAATVQSYTTYMENIFEFYGLDGSSLENDPKNIRENVRLAQPFGALYAAGSHTGIQRSHVVSFLKPFEEAGGNWGLTHEFGHRMDVNARLYGESTNNMLAMFTSVKYNKIDYRIPYETHIYKNVVSDNPPAFAGQGYFERIGVFWQLEMYYPGYWARLNQMYRERKVQLDSSNADNSKMQYLVEFSSEILGKDLTEHFERHGFTVNDDTKERLSIYDKIEDKTWYLNTYAVNYEGDGFDKNTTLSVDKQMTKENGLTLSFSVNKEDQDDVLGYEVYKDGKLVSFSANASYTDKTADVTKESNYEVVAYAYDLSTTKTVAVSNFEPTLLADSKITLGLNETFAPEDYVNAYDHEGNVVSVTVTGNTVDTSKKGTYEVTYSVTVNGYTKQQTAQVEVVSGYDYLSDFDYKSGTTQWGQIRKNSNLSLLVNGNVRAFTKGFGIHANGEIVYDVSKMTYDKFEAYVGVDQSIAIQDNSSIIFKFYADGTEVYNSGLMKHQTEAKFVSLDLKGVKELKLVVDNGGNGNTSDHAVIGGVRLTTNNKKPTITVSNQTYKLGEQVVLTKGVSAFDAEDGDLTNKVEIISKGLEESKPGRYEVVYRVSDSDGNSVETKANITVYEEFAVEKSKTLGSTSLQEYNKRYSLPVVSVSNNGGNYGSSVIGLAVDGKVNTHWETGKPNSGSFTNQVIFDLGEVQEVNRIAYAARSGGKGFAQAFKIYVSTEESGDDFIFAGEGSYKGSVNDKIVITLTKTEARRVKFEFVNAYNSWASIGEMTFYKQDEVADLLQNTLFTDSEKTEVAKEYNSLDKLEALKQSVSDYPAYSLFEEDFALAENMIRASFPTITVPKSVSTKVGYAIDVEGDYQAADMEDGDITGQVTVSGDVNFDQPGEYTVTYSVTDSDGNTVTQTRTIAVVDMADFAYLTEHSYHSTSNSYRAPLLNTAISGNPLRLTAEDGQSVTYEKGIGAHATSTIVYDLTDKNYDYFTAYVGVDRAMYGSVGSVQFKVYVDGDLQFDSGLMTSKQAQKYVEVDINGASELKLMVLDGGNGNGSDHATWGDTKLHYANSKTKGIDRTTLNDLLQKVESLNEDLYTEESYARLLETAANVQAGLSDGYDQKEVDSHLTSLQTAFDALERGIDLTENVTISDKRLLAAIRSELGIKTNEVTIGDMYKLTSLDVSCKGIGSIEGMQYAKNLTTLVLDYNEITDLSALSGLKKLKDVSAIGQYVTVGYPEKKDGMVQINEVVKDREGNKMIPSEILVYSKSGEQTLSASEAMENGMIAFSEDLLQAGLNSIRVNYVSEDGLFEVYTIYMTMK